jgi:hypothetical protein
MLENEPEVEEEQTAPNVTEPGGDRNAGIEAAQEKLNALKKGFKGF